MDHRLRRDRVQADVQCLICGRLIGELFGVVRRHNPARRTPRSATYLSTFRPAATTAAEVPVSRYERFRCFHCGGLGVIEEVSTILVGETVPPEELCVVHGERMRRSAGRPPKGCGCPGKQLSCH